MRVRHLAPASRWLAIACALSTLSLDAAGCGGGGSEPPPAATPPLPTISAQPADQSVSAGQDATFSVTASGNSLAYQWQRSTDGGATFSDLSGATGASLVLTAVALADDASRLRVVVSNAGGGVNSRAALLTVTGATPVAITSTSPLRNGTVNAPYDFQLLASGGTPPFTWSVVGGTLPAGLGLDALTGQISGTPTAAAAYTTTFQVTDSANPPQSDSRSFDITVDAPCDTGLGSVTVAGAPNTVEGKHCPGAGAPPGAPNANGVAFATWTETYPYGGGSYSEHLAVWFYTATGQVESMTFHLNDPTRSITWDCWTIAPGPPACSGVTIDVVSGTVTFLDTALGQNGTMNSPLTLNGRLSFP